MKKTLNSMLLIVLIFTFFSLNINLNTNAQQITEEFLSSQEVHIDEEDVIDISLLFVKVYRLYNPNLQEHFYTTSLNEYNKLVNIGWVAEDWRWHATKVGIGTDAKSIYRLYNIYTGRHLFTTKHSEIKNLVNSGEWKLENSNKPVFYSYGSDTIYRLSNPQNGDHILTFWNEMKKLCDNGWIVDDVKFNGIKK